MPNAACDTLISIPCKRCKEEKHLAVRGEDYAAYQAGGVFVQRAFPYLTAAEREMFVSGMCGECWDSLFGEL